MFENEKKYDEEMAEFREENPELSKAMDKENALIKKRKAFNNAIQAHVDKKAKESRYDNMMSARSYAGYENPFQAEAKKLGIWASTCWAKAGEIESDVQAGNRDIPTVDELLSELPILTD